MYVDKNEYMDVSYIIAYKQHSIKKKLHEVNYIVIVIQAMVIDPILKSNFHIWH